MRRRHERAVLRVRSPEDPPDTIDLRGPLDLPVEDDAHERRVVRVGLRYREAQRGARRGRRDLDGGDLTRWQGEDVGRGAPDRERERAGRLARGRRPRDAEDVEVHLRPAAEQRARGSLRGHRDEVVAERVTGEQVGAEPSLGVEDPVAAGYDRARHATGPAREVVREVPARPAERDAFEGVGAWVAGGRGDGAEGMDRELAVEGCVRRSHAQRGFQGGDLGARRGRWTPRRAASSCSRVEVGLQPVGGEGELRLLRRDRTHGSLHDGGEVGGPSEPRRLARVVEGGRPGAVGSEQERALLEEARADARVPRGADSPGEVQDFCLVGRGRVSDVGSLRRRRRAALPTDDRADGGRGAPLDGDAPRRPGRERHASRADPGPVRLVDATLSGLRSHVDGERLAAVRAVNGHALFRAAERDPRARARRRRRRPGRRAREARRDARARAWSRRSSCTRRHPSRTRGPGRGRTRRTRAVSPATTMCQRARGSPGCAVTSCPSTSSAMGSPSHGAIATTSSACARLHGAAWKVAGAAVSSRLEPRPPASSPRSAGLLRREEAEPFGRRRAGRDRLPSRGAQGHSLPGVVHARVDGVAGLSRELRRGVGVACHGPALERRAVVGGSAARQVLCGSTKNVVTHRERARELGALLLSGRGERERACRPERRGLARGLRGLEQGRLPPRRREDVLEPRGRVAELGRDPGRGPLRLDEVRVLSGRDVDDDVSQLRQLAPLRQVAIDPAPDEARGRIREPGHPP